MEELNARVTDLEIRYTHQQELLTTLNDLVTEQQETIEHLKRRIEQLEAASAQENPTNEKPPHY